MAHLSISCLGPFQVTLDERPVTDFKSNKVRALLAYLAVEADRPHSREVLAGLLWPEYPDSNALSNLRYALSNLRRVICDQTANPPYLLITRDMLRFNDTSDYCLDITSFLVQLEPPWDIEEDDQNLKHVEEAITLYRGEFLEGFSIKDSIAFEEWVLSKRQQVYQQLLTALRYLVTAYEQRGQYDQAQVWARRQIELDPWDEVAHQQLMRNLALSGQRSAALAQYDSCRRLLSKELGVEPVQETTKLYEQIRTGSLKPPRQHLAPLPVQDIKLPRFLEEEQPQVETPVFVARKRELARLGRSLDLALNSRGQVAFVTGEAGSGKTALLNEFCQRSQNIYADLVVANGNCNAYTGIGDPFLPFREILEMLTGNIEAKWAAGAISREHARRLWKTMPVTAQALVETGQTLIGNIVQPTDLLDRMMISGLEPRSRKWLSQLAELVEIKPTKISSSNIMQQSDLFEQYTSVLQTVAQRGSLLLVVDDLQWADLGSISLLFHLGRHLMGSQILIVGAYRPEEIAGGRDEARHPLEPIVNEFQCWFGDILVSMDKAKSRNFVEAFLDSEPNRLSSEFREMLYRRTHGHPLFTIELLRGLQERGDLVQTPDGYWIEGPKLEWETLPARVEAAIAERIGRLDLPLQDVLRVASVEGEVFTAEVVARVQVADDRKTIRLLSGELDRRHHLVRAQAIDRLGSRRISRYRFRNYLFQKYLYDNLDEVERAYFHEDVGNVLEVLYGEQVSEIAVQLAWHFQEAEIAEKAIHYLCQAGEKAVQLSAFQEGIAHLTRGLDLLATLPDSMESAQLELPLQFALGIAWQGEKGARCPEVKHAYTRARELCHQTGNTSQLCQVLGERAVFYYVGAEYQRAREHAEEALCLAHNSEDPMLVAMSHWYLGFISFSLGEFTNASTHFEQVISFYEPQAHHRQFVALVGKDAGLSALAYNACCLWCLGYPEQALKLSQEALALARELNHPFSLADVLCFAGCLFREMRRDSDALMVSAEEMMQLSKEMVPGWRGTGNSYRGDALVMKGQVQEGIEQILEGLAIMRSLDVTCYLSGFLSSLAEAQAEAGQLVEARDTISEARMLIEETNERYKEAELYRLWGEVLIRQGNEAEAETKFQKAIKVAQSQSARSWELRATTSLARLWQKQGKKDEARQVLEKIFSWFTEGFNTPDLKEAEALLKELC